MSDSHRGVQPSGFAATGQAPAADGRRRGPAFAAVLLGVALLSGACAADGERPGPTTSGEGGPGATAADGGGAAGITAQELSRITRELSEDRFQGRGPAGPGEPPTLEYLQSAYRQVGLVPMGDPGDDGERSFLQEVPMVGITADSANLDLEGVEPLRYGPDFVAWTRRQEQSIDVSGELVFVGYGVVAPEENWNDYAGLDMSGKVAVMLVNDPPLEDPQRFGGEAMTYYGRWTYKYEEAARQGAAGALLIHTTESAGYGWNVVESSWSGEQFQLPPDPSLPAPVPVEGWITREVAERLFDAAGLDLEEQTAAAAREGFEAVEMGAAAEAHLDNTFRRITSYNVIGAAPGSENEDEYVLFSAHWDHLGVGSPVDGDAIYNGAVDNATGVAALLEIAEAWTTGQPRPRRSGLFIATTAEEQGLLGAAYYATHPVVPLEKSLAVINIDGLNVWGPTEDMTVIGLGNSTLDDTLAEVLNEQRRTVTPDPEPEKGYFYRSDHFPFAKVGVPALYTDYGTRFVGRPEGFSDQVRADYRENRYHQPSDEFDPSWDFSGAEQDVRTLFQVGLRVAEADIWPEWSPGTEFRAVRQQMLSCCR